MRELRLYKRDPNINLVSQIDDHEYERVVGYRWGAAWNTSTRSFYACRSIYINGKQRPLYLHRLLLGLDFDDPRQGDHIQSGDTLNNQHSNLRISTQEQNKMNKRMYRNNSLGVKGVINDPKGSLWHKAQIQVHGKRVFLGRRKSIAEAEVLYLEACKKHFGEFAYRGETCQQSL